MKSASDSNLRGATASLGGATRGTVVNVKSQFDPLGSYPSAAGGAGDTATWTKFSYHALVFFNQSRYTTAAPAYSIKNTHTFTTQAACADAVCDDTSKMYCSDCHRSTLNAHGGVNAEYLLRACDGAAANGCATSDTNDALGSFGLGNAVCYRCHPKTKYVNKGAGGVHGPENAGDLTEVFGPPYDSGTRNASKGTLFGLGCIHCHGGTTYGGIHGSGEAIPFANLATTRKAWRFMNGSSQSEYNPIDTNTAADTGQPGQDKARWATAHRRRAYVQVLHDRQRARPGRLARLVWAARTRHDQHVPDDRWRGITSAELLELHGPAPEHRGRPWYRAHDVVP